MSEQEVPQLRFKGFDEEWALQSLGEVAQLNPGSPVPEIFEYVDLASVVGTDMVSHRTERRVTAPSRAQRVAQRGDIFYQTVRPYQKNNHLFNRNGATYVFSTGYAQLRPMVDSRYLFAAIQRDEFLREILDRCTGTSFPAIAPSQLKDIGTSFPISNDEQQAVGRFFSKLDSLITGKQFHVDKLQQTKTALLQRMFPQGDADEPELRFEGFTSKWERRRLGDLGSTYGGLTGKTKAAFGHGEARYVTYMDVFQHPMILDTSRCGVVEIDPKQHEVKTGDALFTVSSETPHEVGMAAVWLGTDSDVYLNSFCFGFRPQVDLDSFFFAYALRSVPTRQQFELLAQGISRFNISKNKAMDINIQLPDLPEQHAIGSFFTKLDSLISAKQLYINKLQQVKSGLLQKMFI